MKTIRQYQSRYLEKQIYNQLFFRILLCAAILLIILLLGENTIQAQVQVTGHVFAEIVEPTALSAKANNKHLIETGNTINNNELILAEVKLSGGQNLNIDVSVTSSNLIGTNGEIIPFYAYTCPGCTIDPSNTPDSEKLYTLKATPVESIYKKKNSTYNGRYSVVFMYN